MTIDPLPSLVATGFASGDVRVMDYSHDGLGNALRITTSQPSSNPWDRSLFTLGTHSINKNDTLLATFQIRTVNMDTTAGYVRFVVQSASSPYDKSVDWSLKAGPTWQQYQIPFHSIASYQALLYSAQFWLPAGPQTVEIASFSIKDYGQVAIESLNVPSYPYVGHDPGASWRSDAAARIEQLRKGNVSVTVRDAQGHPVANAPVHLSMVRPAFAFGSAVDSGWLRDTTSDGDNYRHVFLTNFSSAVLENDLKWPQWESDHQSALLGLAWLRSSGIQQVRGHNLIWPNWQYMPPDLQNLQSKPDQVRLRINTHLNDEVGATQGLVSDWDVVNEPTSANVLLPILGAAEIPAWYNTVHARDPAAKLYMNETGLVDDGGQNLPQQDAFFRTAQSVIAGGGPLQGIGIQAHFSDHLTPPEDVYAILDRYAGLKTDLKITEFDIDTPDESLQADYLRDFLTIAFSHPKVNGFYLWGFWEGRDWKPQTAMYRLDWSPKAMAAVWHDLVYKQWWSDVSGYTDAHGTFTARVFFGDYTADAVVDGKTSTSNFSYSSAASDVSVALGPYVPGPLSPNSLRNSASGLRGAVAAGEQLLIQTDDFGPEPPVKSSFSTSGDLPQFSAGRRVLINGVYAPIVEVTANSILTVLPQVLGSVANLQLELFGVRTNSVSLPVSEASPGIVTVDGSGRGFATATTDDGSSVDPAMGARKGSFVTIRVTGAGIPQSVDAGKAVTSPSPLDVAVSVTLDGSAVEVASASWVEPGIVAVRFRIPLEASGPGKLLVRVAGQTSQDAVTLAMK